MWIERLESTLVSFTGVDLAARSQETYKDGLIGCSVAQLPKCGVTWLRVMITNAYKDRP
jgi:hypothetical protein